MERLHIYMKTFTYEHIVQMEIFGEKKGSDGDGSVFDRRLRPFFSKSPLIVLKFCRGPTAASSGLSPTRSPGLPAVSNSATPDRLPRPRSRVSAPGLLRPTLPVLTVSLARVQLAFRQSGGE